MGIGKNRKKVKNYINENCLYKGTKETPSFSKTKTINSNSKPETQHGCREGFPHDWRH